MGDRFRSMIESELAEVDTPPIGDLIDNAIRDGRQLRRTRLVQRTVACAAAVGVLALGLGMASASLGPAGDPGGGYAADRPATARPAVPASPEPASGPPPQRATASVPANAPTMAIVESEPMPPGAIAKTPPASPAVVLLALQTVLPSGPTVAYAGSVFDSYTGVQLYLDRGAGYGMIRVAVARYQNPPKCVDGAPGIVLNCSKDAGSWVETFEIEANCVQRRGVTVYRLDGIAVQVNMGSCGVDASGVDSIDESVLEFSEAIRIGNDPIWSDRSLGGLDEKARSTHPYLPMLIAFNGVGA